MKKRVFIVHGWDGYPEEGWYPWLKEKLVEKGFEVFVPQLPEPENPRIFNWVPKLKESVGKVDEETYFVGHSMGCQTIARFLETLPEGEKVGGAIFVGGYFKNLTLGEEENDPEIKETSDHWLKAPLNFEKVKYHLPKSIAIFSDNDEWVPLNNQDDFKDKLGSKIIIEKGMGHFTQDENVFELPTALEAVLKLSGDQN